MEKQIKPSLAGFKSWFFKTGKWILGALLIVTTVGGIIYSAAVKDVDGVKAGVIFLVACGVLMTSGYFYDVWAANKRNK